MIRSWQWREGGSTAKCSGGGRCRSSGGSSGSRSSIIRPWQGKEGGRTVKGSGGGRSRSGGSSSSRYTTSGGREAARARTRARAGEKNNNFAVFVLGTSNFIYSDSRLI